jgi:tetratricopeptide (TPR) repeat protein
MNPTIDIRLLESAKLQAIDLSNQGAAFLITKKYILASKSFVEALELCKEGMRLANHMGDDQEVDEDDDEHMEDGSATKCHFLNSCQNTLHLSHSDIGSCYDEDSQMIPESQEEPPRDGYVHKNPIHIPVPTNSTSSLPSFPFISGIVIFNQALTLHLGAIHGLSHEQKLTDGQHELRKAMRMYEVGYSLLEQDVDPNPRVVLAIVNNMGHAYSTMGEVELAEEYSEQLLSLLMIYISSSGGSDNLGGLGCFFGNAMPRSMISSSPAA